MIDQSASWIPLSVAVTRVLAEAAGTGLPRRVQGRVTAEPAEVRVCAPRSPLFSA